MLARALRRRGHRQHIICPSTSRLAERARVEGFEVDPLTSVPKLRRILHDVQIAHAHSGRAQTLSFFATAGLPVRRIATRHVAFEPRHPRIHRLKYAVTCHGVIAVSNFVKQALTGAGVSEESIEVIPNGVEWPERTASPEDREASRRKFGLSSDHFVLGHLGAFTHEKGQDVALDAIILLKNELPDLRLLLAGEGPLRESPEMQDRVQQSEGRAILPGHVTDRAEFFAALDLFIMPSRSEGWGLAALEAMAHGVPVVASDVGGLPEIVGSTGWLVTPGDPQALADAIVRAAADREILREAGVQSRERAKLFSVEQMAERTENYYRRVLAEAGQEPHAEQK